MDLEKKLKELEESCLKMASKETDAIKEDIKQELEDQMKVELDEYTNRKEWNFNKTIEKLEKDFMKEVFYFQTQCKKEILKAKEDMDKDLKKLVIKKLEDYTKSDDYKTYLFNSIDSVLKKSNGSSNISIGITSKDYTKYKAEIKKSKKVNLNEINDCYIGGCILKSDEIYINNTLLNNLEEKMMQENE